MVADRLRSHAVGDLPEVVAGVQIDGGDGAVRRLEDGQTARAADAAGADAHPVHVGVRVDIDPRDQARCAAAPRRRDVEDAGLGVHGRAAGDVGSAVGAGAVDGGLGTVGRALDGGGIEERAQAEVLHDVERHRAQFGGEVDQVVLGDPLHLVGGGAGDVGLGRRQLLAGHVGLRDGALLDRPHGFAGLAVQDVGPALLGGLHDGRDVLPVHGDVHQVGCGGVVVVPDVVVHGLEVPPALPGLHVDGEDGGGEEVVARVESAEVVDRRRVGDHIDESQIRVGGERRPCGHVAGPLPGVVLPGVVAEFALLGDHVEGPEVLSGCRVVREHVPGHVLLHRLVVPLLMRVADHDHAVDHDRGRRVGDVADFRGQAVLGVVVPGAEVVEEVDGSVLAEGVDRPAGVGVERVQEEAGGDQVDHSASVHVRVGDALPVVLPHRVLPPLGVRLAVGPQRLAGGGIDGHRGPA